MSIRRSSDTFILQNDHIRRVVNCATVPVTTDFGIRPYGRLGQDAWTTTLNHGSVHPAEAIVTVDGMKYLAGPGTPLSGADSHANSFVVAESTIHKTKLGERLTLRCRPRTDSTPSLELEISYEIAATLPLLIRSVTATNIGPKRLIIENLTVEMIDHNRPAYTEELQFFSDWYDTYAAVNRHLEDYRGWISYQFPTPINVILGPGETLESFRLFLYPAPSGDGHAKTVAHHRILKTLAPWISHPPVSQQVDAADSMEELQVITDNAAALGVEMVHLFMTQVFDNLGDYQPRQDIFPNGADDVKRCVDYFHKRKVRVVPYCSLTMATQPGRYDNHSRICEEHPDWQYLGPGGLRYSSWGWGNMCYQSPWGQYIEEKMRWITEDLGFDGYHIDGPYHGLPCEDPTHAHLTPESTFYMNWQWEKRFLQNAMTRGYYVTMPQDPAALLFGSHARPGGYTEMDFTTIGGMGLVNILRGNLADARRNIPACCSWGWLAVDPYYAHSIEASEDDTSSFEHACATCFGLGHWGLLHGRRLFIGPKTEAVFRKWLDIYKTHRDTFNGEMLTLVRPDGRRPDAVLHVNPGAQTPAVAVIFNPSPERASVDLRLPLSYAGAPAGAIVRIGRYGERTCDSRGDLAVRIDLDPLEVIAVPISITADHV